MVRGRPADWQPKIKPLTKTQKAAAQKPSNAVPKNLVPVKRGGITVWEEK